MDASRRIRKFLSRVRRRLIRRERARALYELVAGAALAAATLPLLAATDAGTRPARALGLVALAALAIVALVRGLFAPWRRYADDRVVARVVGEARPELASDLLSTVELASDRRSERSGEVSSALIAALASATAERADAIAPATVIDRTPLRRPARLAVLGLALTAATAVLLPTRVARGWRNLIAPPEKGAFADATRSETPLVGDLTITLEPPAYTGRPATTLPGATGDFRALPGTRVTLATEALVTVEQAYLALGDDRSAREDAIVPLAVEGATLRGQLTVAAETRYRFLLVDPGGRRSLESRTRLIELEVDQAPAVELHAPADELDVSGLKRIELAYLASDDHGLRQVDLVWEGDAGEGRKALLRGATRQKTAQEKVVWDLAEVGVRPGTEVTYWIEVTDNDDVRGPNKGESRRFKLRVLSPREKHERLLASQREAFEKLVALLAGRLTIAPPDGTGHEGLLEQTRVLIVGLGTLVAALEKDPLADKKLPGFLAELRERLDRAVDREHKLLRRAAGKDGRLPAALPAALAREVGGLDKAQAERLEDDVVALADWIGRQDLENLLALSDEIATHKKRLDKLMEEYARTGSDATRREIERELRALEQLIAEQAARRGGIAEDVLDQFVNAEALDRKASEDCISEVRKRIAAGDGAGARAKMAECGAGFDKTSAALEEALGELRGDRFSAEERRLEELQKELSDLAEAQKEIAGKLGELNRRYNELAAREMKDKAAEAAAQLGELADRLKKKLDKVPEGGLGAFEKEELGAARTRLGDLGRMLAEGDLAEGLAMARQAEAGLETIAGELEIALEEAPDARFARQLEQAREQIAGAQPLAAQLVDELEKSTPAPSEILGADELGQLDRLRRAQQAAAERAGKLREKAKGMAGELPGQAGQAIEERLGKAGEAMGRAGERMRAKDPSGARPEAQAAADALDAAGQDARGAARMRQAQDGSGMRDEPVRIPGADEYKPPVHFREQIMEAMKRQNEAPAGYGEMLRRYYEELSR